MSLAGSSNANTQAAAPANDPAPPLEHLLQEIVANPGATSLLKTLRSINSKDVRDTVLAGTLPGGQDPLSALDPQENTLGTLYIL